MDGLVRLRGRRLRALGDECEQVFVCGLSMGGGAGAAAGRAARRRRCPGWSLVNPVINISRSADADPAGPARCVPSLAGIANDIAKPGDGRGAATTAAPLRAPATPRPSCGLTSGANLDRVDQPLLVYRSVNDHVVDPSSVQLIKAGVESSDQTYVELERSYHVATLDYDAEEIFAEALRSSADSRRT